MMLTFWHMSYTQSTYQLIWSTKHRERTLVSAGHERLFGHIAGTLKAKQCHLMGIGAAEDHLHIVTSIHQTIAVANLVKDIKLSAEKMILTSGIMPGFRHWQNEYAMFTYGVDARPDLIRYVKNQQAHHRTETSLAELERFLAEHQIPYNPKYLE